VDFSKDAGNDVLADAKLKALDNFKALAASSKALLIKQANEKPVGKGKVALPELKRQLSSKSDTLNKLFASVDKNHNNVLEFDEFAMVVNKLYGENLHDETIKALLREADLNNDNVVSYNEFAAFLHREGLESKAQAVERKMEKLPKIKLSYFDGRGRAECTRLIFAEGGIPYDDHRVKDWPKDKAKSPFGQLPMMEVDDVVLCESHAIERYAAKLTGLYGNGIMEQAHIDQICEAVIDIATPFATALFDKDEKVKAAGLEKFWTTILPAWNDRLEKLLASNKGSSYFVGKQLSLADIAVYNIYAWITGMNDKALNAHPQLVQHSTRVSSRPNIAKWIATRPKTAF